MSEITSGGKPSMKKSLYIGGTLAVVLIAVIIVLAVMLGNKSSKLADSEAQVTSLQADVSALKTDKSSLQTQLAQSQTKNTSLQTELDTTNEQTSKQIESLNKTIDADQKTITSQTDTIQTMKYSHNFSTVDELTSWLQKNNPVTWDPNTLTAIQRAEMALSLEVKAARDGYIMPAILPLFGNVDWMTNRTIVGDVVYEIKAWDGTVQIGGRVTPTLPSYPITPESGK
jgi:valyl-tRNA synthetase